MHCRMLAVIAAFMPPGSLVRVPHVILVSKPVAFAGGG